MLGKALRKGFSWSATERPFLLQTGYSTVAGTRVSPSTAMAASAVYSATSLIAETIASLPIRFLERGDAGRVPQKPAEARVFWDRPNPLQTTTGLIATTVLSDLLYGNAYLYPRRTNGGDVFELWPLDPDRVADIETFEAGDSIAVRYRFIDDLADAVNRPGKPAQLIHHASLTAPGRIKGISRIEQQAELIGLSLSAQEHAARFLGDGVHMSGWLETPGQLTEAQAKALWQNFSKAHAGPKKTGGIGVLSGGATFKTLTVPPQDLQFLEQMKYSDQKIASIFRVPPHMVGDVERSTSWGTGIEEQTIQFVQHTLLPIIRRLEEVFEATLLAGTRYQMRFVTAGLLRGSLQARKEFYQAMWQLGVFSADDIRALEDQPPLPDNLGKIYYVPLNFAPVGADLNSLPSAGKLLLQMLAEGRAAA